nr:GTP cyclohydrolase I [Nonomuraea sediminis]
MAEHFAYRSHVQERLTHVADWLQVTLSPRGVGVVMTAEHSRMTLRARHEDRDLSNAQGAARRHGRPQPKGVTEMRSRLVAVAGPS